MHSSSLLPLVALKYWWRFDVGQRDVKSNSSPKREVTFSATVSVVLEGGRRFLALDTALPCRPFSCGDVCLRPRWRACALFCFSREKEIWEKWLRCEIFICHWRKNLFMLLYSSCFSLSHFSVMPSWPCEGQRSQVFPFSSGRSLYASKDKSSLFRLF